MRKVQTLSRLVEAGFVAVVRAGTGADALGIAEALVAGGVRVIEITFTVPEAAEVIRRLAGRFPSEELLLGAGTVLDAETARMAILAGARFLAAPSLSAGTARLANRYAVPYIPGAGSVGEVVEAMECGADIVKVFPGESLGPAFIRAVRGPLPQASLMPTGGVTLENVHEWIGAGAVALGVGRALTGAADQGDFDAVTDRAKAFLAAVARARA